MTISEPRAGTAYAVADPRRCAECGNGLPAGSPGQRRLCDRCRQINTALKYLRAASIELDGVGDFDAIVGDIERAIGAAELRR